jgi:DNA-binding NarL/FixJ family response regulator
VSIRVLIADDQALLRATFRLLLDSEPDIDVVAEAATGAEVLVRARAAGADVVLMDLRMPEMDGIEAIRRITADSTLAAVKILVVSTFETEDLVAAALRAGAGGFLSKGVEPSILLHAIRTVAGGESLLSPAATTALIGRLIAQAIPALGATSGPLLGLTVREREVSVLVGTGLSNLEIARRLSISAATVKTHVNRAMMKIGARDRAQLVVFAYETGLVVAGATPPGPFAGSR